MSGHSHAKTIKHQKGLADAKRSAAFSKMAKEIEVAAKDGGDPIFNSKLRMAIERAKKVNMPTENIERAIKRGTGELEGGKLEEVSLEAYGPGNIAIIIEGITDNKNRTLSEIRKILHQYNGKLIAEGAVKWMFEQKGLIVVSLEHQTPNPNPDELELAAIEAGADDIRRRGDGLINIYTRPEDLEKVRRELEKNGVKAELVSLEWTAKDVIEVDEATNESCQKLFASLDENDAVQEIYSNLKE